MHAPCRRGSPPKRAVPVALGPTQDQTSAAISIRRVARLSRNVGQPDHILANPVISHKAERRPGSGEIWFAVTKHDGVQVDSILIDQAKFGEALRQGRASNFDLPVALGLQLADRALKIILNKPGVGADRLQRARDDPFRLVPPQRREGVFLYIPFRMIVVPVTHDLIHLATVDAARLPPSLLDEVAEERGAWRKRHMVDVAVQGLIHSEHELSHTPFAICCVSPVWRVAWQSASFARRSVSVRGLSPAKRAQSCVRQALASPQRAWHRNPLSAPSLQGRSASPVDGRAVARSSRVYPAAGLGVFLSLVASSSSCFAPLEHQVAIGDGALWHLRMR